MAEIRSDLLRCDDLETVPAAKDVLKAGVREAVAKSECVTDTEAELRRVEESSELLDARPDGRAVPEAVIDAAEDAECAPDSESVGDIDSDLVATADTDASAVAVDELDVTID